MNAAPAIGPMPPSTPSNFASNRSAIGTSLSRSDSIAYRRLWRHIIRSSTHLRFSIVFGDGRIAPVGETRQAVGAQVDHAFGANSYQSLTIAIFLHELS